jgi:Asp-tRNA(Asn)/Glu-tRNA(Gln) amidotransferase A subunit family amidase
MTMDAANENLTPAVRPYLAATTRFATGGQTPRAFLEDCLAALAAWEPRIGAFVCTDLPAARAAADQATERWRAGRPLSPIDGMPVGIKDIIETAELPTEQGSPLFPGWRMERDAASVVALREAGAVIVGKTVTTEFASTEPRGTRNPWDARRTPGGSSSGSAAAVAVGILPAALGTQVIGSTIRPASYCGCFGFKPTVGALNRGGSFDGLSQSCTGVLAASREDAWQVAYEIAARAGGDPGCPGLYGPAAAPAAVKPRRLVVLETAGWAKAASAGRRALEDAIARLRRAGIEVVTRQSEPKADAVEAAIAEARPVSMRINAWEWRWPLNTYSRRDASKLSRAARDRLKDAEAMTLDEYRTLIAERARIRAVYARLKDVADACVTLAAPAAAPVGLETTGDPIFAVPFSLLGVPAVSLPVLRDEGLPLGLQLTGFEHEDAVLFGHAASVLALFDAARD